MSLSLSPEAAALLHLIEPWGASLSDDELQRLSSRHGRDDVLFEAAMYISNNTYVSLKDIAVDDLESAGWWLINGQLVLRGGTSKGEQR